MIAFLSIMACRPDPGAPEYPTADDLPNWGGPDPYEEGEERLSLGIFYEMGSSEAYVIDNSANFFYIWSNTFSLFTSDQRIEGTISHEVVVGTLGWWGGGVFWSEEVNLGEWTTMHVSLKTGDERLSAIEIGIGQGDGEIIHWFPAEEYGFVYDNEWNHLLLPLSVAWDALDSSRIQMPFNIRGSGPEGASLLIDNVYFTKEDEV